MSFTAKILIAGPLGGLQSECVAAISDVKVRSSARNPSGDSFVAMDFGRRSLGEDLDLQLFGFDRAQIEVVADAIAPGIVGGLFLATEEDIAQPANARDALSSLANRQIPTLLVLPPGVSDSVADELGMDPEQVFRLESVDREAVKAMLVRLLETVLARVEDFAA